MEYSRKNPILRGGRGWGAEDKEFPGVLKKEHVEIPEVNSKRSWISSSDREKIMPSGISIGLGFLPWNF